MKAQELQPLALKDVLDYSTVPHNVARYISPELGMVHSIEGVSDISHIFFKGQPYRLTEGRVLYLRSGYVCMRLNLIEIKVEAHQLKVISPDTIIELQEISPDCDITMLAIANSFMENWQREKLLAAYLQGTADVILRLDEAAERRMEEIFTLIWNILQDNPFSHESIQGMISVLFHQIGYFQNRGLSGKKETSTRQEEVFDRFIRLINKHAVNERNISFYAENLFLTPRYLSTLIRETSGKTVMEWVNEAVIQEAKLMLCHTDKLVYQIADELNFPNASFFCKFFHRMTGKTPNGYRCANRQKRL